MDLAEGGPHQV